MLTSKNFLQKTRAIFLLCGLLAVGLARATNAQTKIQFSGVLGQSQPPETPPLPTVGGGGVARIGDHLWLASGPMLWGFAWQNGGWINDRQVVIPAPVRLSLRDDGERIFVADYTDKIYAFDPRKQGAAAMQPLGAIPRSARAWAVAPVGLEKGFAGQNKIFVLNGDAVTTIKADGTDGGTVLGLARPEKATWPYVSLAVEPTTGDLLVGSYYPDIKVYRFGADGQQIVTDGWPRNAFAQEIVNVPGQNQAWALMAGGGAKALPAVAKGIAPEIAPFWSYHIFGLTTDPNGGYWISSLQGVSGFDKNGAPLKTRLGGMAGVRSLAIATDGTVIATLEGGQRLVRLGLDDEPNAILTSNGNEPWRVAGGYKDKASGLIWSGEQALVLDETAGALWKFDPQRTGGGEKPWVIIAEDKTFSNPRALAGNDATLWVLDDQGLLEAAPNAPDKWQTATLPGLADLSPFTRLAATGDALVVAGAREVRAFARGAGGAYSQLWQTDVAGVTGIAATSDAVMVSDGSARSVVALDAKSGKTLATLDPKTVPGGLTPGALAAQGKWILVADENGKRLLRFSLK